LRGPLSWIAIETGIAPIVDSGAAVRYSARNPERNKSEVDHAATHDDAGVGCALLDSDTVLACGLQHGLMRAVSTSPLPKRIRIFEATTPAKTQAEFSVAFATAQP
jgi:hypothetical protein